MESDGGCRAERDLLEVGIAGVRVCSIGDMPNGRGGYRLVGIGRVR